VVVAGAFGEHRLLGGAMLFHHDPAHQKAELGCWTVAAGEGLGLAYAACRTLIALAREHLGAERLEWLCSAENVRSRRLAERLGFTYEGTLRSNFVLHGRRHDTDILSLVGHELE
jgi:RimJ/RimL family protein N-acetyltransferase